LIASIIVLANWRVVLATLAILSLLVILFSFLGIVTFLRKVTRPIGQLSLLDVAIVTWVYRRWERFKMRHRPSGLSDFRVKD
jgi:hypothetical protein